MSRTSDFKPDAVSIMSEELSGAASKYMTLSRVKAIVEDMLLLVILIALLVIIVEGVNLYWRKCCDDDAHAPAAFLITMHMIVIGVFVWQTQFLTFYLYSVERARTMAAALALLAILLLAARGMLYNRSMDGIMYAISLAIMVPVTSRYYKELEVFNHFTIPHAIQFVLIMMVLTAAAVYFCWVPAESKNALKARMLKKFR